MDERTGHAARVVWLLVAGLFACICYSLGFNAGCEEGEGRLWRRQMRRVRDAAEVHLVETRDGLANVPAQTIEPDDEPAMRPPTGPELFADVLGRSVPPTVAAGTTHEEAF